MVAHRPISENASASDRLASNPHATSASDETLPARKGFSPAPTAPGSSRQKWKLGRQETPAVIALALTAPTAPTQKRKRKYSFSPH